MSKVKGNPGVERVVLAGLCQYGKDAYYDVSDIINTKTFSLDSNQALYRCLEKIFTHFTLAQQQHTTYNIYKHHKHEHLQN